MSTDPYRRLSLNLDISQITNLVQVMPEFEREIIDATKPALKRTAEHIITKSGQIVSKYYEIKSSDVKKTFSEVRNRSGFIWAVESKGKRPILTKFPHRPGSWSAYQRQKPRPTIQVKIRRNEGFKTLQSKKLGPFMIPLSTTAGGKVTAGIYRRETMKREPIVPMWTKAVPQMITSLNVAKEISDSANEMLTNRLDHEILRRFRNLGKQVAK